MRRLVLAVAVLAALTACGGESAPLPAATAPVGGAIPDSAGQLVEPVPTGSADPAKAFEVPDAAGTTDLVSAEDARFLAGARPAVPYAGPDGAVSNSTLIAMGRKACQSAPSYEAGGRRVDGPQAAAVHAAATSSYC